MEKSLGYYVGVSLAAHLVLFVVLSLSVSFSRQTPVKPANSAPIKAVAVTEAEVNAFHDKRKAEQRAERKRQQELERKRKEKAEAERQRKLAAEKKRKAEEAERKRVAELERKRKADAEAKRKQDAEAKRKREAEAERKRQQALEQKRQQEVEAKQKAEAERKRKAEAERKRQAEEARKRKEQEELEQLMMAGMNEGLEAEQALASQQVQQQVLTEIEKYKALIQGKIMRNLNTQGIQGQTCKLSLKLTTNGLVLGVKGIEGKRIVCDEAVRAVKRAEPLPMSPDPEVAEKMRDINLTVSIER